MVFSGTYIPTCRTLDDACSLAVLEGLASARLVVTTDPNGASGVISHGEDGWVIEEVKTGDEITMAIRYFLDNEIRIKASYRGRSEVEFYSEKSNFDRKIEIFNAAMARSGQSHRGDS